MNIFTLGIPLALAFALALAPGALQNQGESTQEWFLLDDGVLARIEVEKRLYQKKADTAFSICCRITNKTDHPIAADLRDPSSCIYPNQWGMYPESARQVINERRIPREPLGEA